MVGWGYGWLPSENTIKNKGEICLPAVMKKVLNKTTLPRHIYSTSNHLIKKCKSTITGLGNRSTKLIICKYPPPSPILRRPDSILNFKVKYFLNFIFQNGGAGNCVNCCKASIVYFIHVTILPKLLNN